MVFALDVTKRQNIFKNDDVTLHVNKAYDYGPLLPTRLLTPAMSSSAPIPH